MSSGPLRTDIGATTAGRKAFTVQSYIEANSKNGSQFEGSTLLIDVAGGASNDTIFITGALPVILKARNIGYSGSAVSALIYELPTYTGGVVTAFENTNAINPKVGLSQILVGATVTDIGTIFASPVHFLGGNQPQGKGSASVAAMVEHVLKPSTPYLFRLTSLDSVVQNIASHLSWFEGYPDIPNND